MKIYARFDTEGICQGFIRTSDPSAIISKGYEPVFGEEQIAMVTSGKKCKRIIDPRGRTRIVFV